MRAFVTVGTVIALSLGMWGCDGSGYSSVTGNPTSPTPDGSGVVTPAEPDFTIVRAACLVRQSLEVTLRGITS